MLIFDHAELCDHYIHHSWTVASVRDCSHTISHSASKWQREGKRPSSVPPSGSEVFCVCVWATIIQAQTLLPCWWDVVSSAVGREVQHSLWSVTGSLSPSSCLAFNTDKYSATTNSRENNPISDKVSILVFMVFYLFESSWPLTPKV